MLSRSRAAVLLTVPFLLFVYAGAASADTIGTFAFPLSSDPWDGTTLDLTEVAGLGSIAVSGDGVFSGLTTIDFDSVSLTGASPDTQVWSGGGLTFWITSFVDTPYVTGTEIEGAGRVEDALGNTIAEGGWGIDIGSIGPSYSFTMIVDAVDTGGGGSSPTPEPSAALLYGFGLATVAWRVRRGRRA